MDRNTWQLWERQTHPPCNLLKCLFGLLQKDSVSVRFAPLHRVSSVDGVTLTEAQAAGIRVYVTLFPVFFGGGWYQVLAAGSLSSQEQDSVPTSGWPRAACAARSRSSFFIFPSLLAERPWLSHDSSVWAGWQYDDDCHCSGPLSSEQELFVTAVDLHWLITFLNFFLWIHNSSRPAERKGHLNTRRSKKKKRFLYIEGCLVRRCLMCLCSVENVFPSEKERKWSTWGSTSKVLF